MGKSPKFCQIYFINNQESQVATRCQIVGGLRPDIVSNINQLLHNDNHYVQLFKVAKDFFDQQDVPTNIRVVISMKQRDLQVSISGGTTFQCVMRWVC